MSVDEYREQGVFHLSIDGQEYRVPQYCPHRAGRLAHGEINRQRRTIACPLHHSVFSLETGEQLSGPPCGGLAVEKCVMRSDSPGQDGLSGASFLQGALAGFANPRA